MKTYQKQFIDFCIQNQVIRFGEFVLKSGRKSPYFFNAGLFNTGEMLLKLGKFYADAVCDADIEFDLLFGPAYKGIPLVVTTAIALAEEHNINKPICFNRKTAKDHGEGGNLIGAPLKGKILVVDDVITAGTAVRETFKIIKDNNAELGGVVIALDRQEKGEGNLSAIQEIEKKHHIKVISIISLDDMINYLHETPNFKVYINQIEHYREQYGCS